MNSPDSDSHPGRLFASRALVVLASVAIMLALVVAYASQAGVDSDQFANRATVALRDDRNAAGTSRSASQPVSHHGTSPTTTPSFMQR